MRTILISLITIQLLAGCADTHCTYEDYLQLDRLPDNTIVYKTCTREQCPGSPDRITCRQR